jgi:vacuolar-type H+-ATPase subunit I/STV1
MSINVTKSKFNELRRAAQQINSITDKIEELEEKRGKIQDNYNHELYGTEWMSDSESAELNEIGNTFKYGKSVIRKDKTWSW